MIKTKKILITLAMIGANVMPLHTAFALEWYGTTGGFVDSKPNPAVTTGVNLEITDTTMVGSYDVEGVGKIYGGYVGSGGDAITGNSITVNINTKRSIAQFSGGYVDTGNGNITGNSVIINSGTYPDGAMFYGGCGMLSGAIMNNSVIVNGGNFGSSVTFYGASTMGGRVENNSVTINGGNFANGVKLYGGSTIMGTKSGNTLNLRIKMEGKASEVKYFQIMNFTLPSDIINGDTMLSTASVTYDNTIIGVDAANGVTLKKDDQIYLIKADGGYGSISNDGATVLGGAGQISLDGVNLILTMLQDYGGTPTGGSEDQQKAPVEGVAATAAMVNASADLASGEGMASLLANTVGGADTFGAMNAGSSKYKTGSHVDMDGWGVLIGAGTTKNWTSGDKTTYGLFFEYGKGDFDTYNNDIHGEGDSNNKGVGVIARHTLNNNTYIDGAVRYGKQETEWSESEIGGYDTDSRYYGAAVGLGHVYPLENNDELDVYVRYSYGHVGASDAKVKDSDYHFDRVLSQRLRFGAKYNFAQKDNKAKPYVGMAWERELKGESRATITGVGEAPAPSLKGNTGIFEIGCDWDTGKWTLGAGANAYIGKRKGWSGTARAFYNF